MTQAASDALQIARDKILQMQRTCAFCGATFKSSDWLALHIMRNHSESHEYPSDYCDKFERYILLKERQ